MVDPVDIVIPLGTGSRRNNDELRLLLRSLAVNGRNYRGVIIVASAPPEWLQNVRVLQMDDPLEHNKDGNIIRKVLAGMQLDYVTPEVVVSWDDIVYLRPFDFAALPPIFNARGPEAFPETGSIWQRRVRRTFDFLASRGVVLEHNFESHTPHRYPVRRLLRAMRDIDFAGDIGYSIDTLFHGVLGISGGFDQGLFKETRETPGTAKLDKMIVGYNDAAFLGGLREQLFGVFAKPSKYEKD